MQPQRTREKHYVGVDTTTDEDGKVTPRAVVWDDGRRFEVDRVIDRRQARATRTGAAGMRYTVMVGGQITQLFYEGPRWFVEAKVTPEP